MLAAGYRDERLDGDAVCEGQRSNSVGSGVIVLGIGTETFDAQQPTVAIMVGMTFDRS